MLNFLFRRFRRPKRGTTFASIPIDAEGALFVSPMPYGRYDSERVFRFFLRENVDHVIMLLGDEEIQQRSRKDLKGIYTRHGMAITQIPIGDFLEPRKEQLRRELPGLVEKLKEGSRMVVHCHAGVGRTAVVTACLLALLTRDDADRVIAFMRRYMEINLTLDQRGFIEGWVETEGRRAAPPRL